jgi:hypothetical protein
MPALPTPPHKPVERLRLQALLRPDTKLVVVNFPHNPTGQAASQDMWDAMLAACRAAGSPYLLSDEMYRFLGGWCLRSGPRCFLGALGCTHPPVSRAHSRTAGQQDSRTAGQQDSMARQLMLSIQLQPGALARASCAARRAIWCCCWRPADVDPAVAAPPSAVDQYERAITLCGLSKSWGLPGGCAVPAVAHTPMTPVMPGRFPVLVPASASAPPPSKHTPARPRTPSPPACCRPAPRLAGPAGRRPAGPHLRTA